MSKHHSMFSSDAKVSIMILIPGNFSSLLQYFTTLYTGAEIRTSLSERHSKTEKVKIHSYLLIWQKMAAVLEDFVSAKFIR